MINIGIWPMVILALLIIANSIFMVYKTVDVKNANDKKQSHSGTDPLNGNLIKTLCSRLLILCILQEISSLVFVEFDYYYSFNVFFDNIYYNMIRAIKLIIDVKSFRL